MEEEEEDEREEGEEVGEEEEEEKPTDEKEVPQPPKSITPPPSETKAAEVAAVQPATTAAKVSLAEGGELSEVEASITDIDYLSLSLLKWSVAVTRKLPRELRGLVPTPVRRPKS